MGLRRKAVLAAVLAAGLTLALLLRPSDAGPQRPLPVLTLTPGQALIAGLRVPPGTVLLGRPFPLSRTRTVALLRITDEPVAAMTDLVEQLTAAGYDVYSRGSKPGRVCEEFRSALYCQLGARLPDAGPGLATPELRPPVIEADLLAGPASEQFANSFTVTTSTNPADRRFAPDDAQNRVTGGPALGGFTSKVRAAAPEALPAPGDTFRAGRTRGDEFTVDPGSTLISLQTGLVSTGEWAECSAGAFRAVVAVTGDPDKIVDGYADQVPGHFGSRSDDHWRVGSQLARHTEVSNPILLASQTAMAELSTVTTPTGDSFLLMDFCRE